MKLCPVCNENISVDGFYKDKSKKDGLSWACKECVKRRVNERRLENLDEYNAKQRERVKKRASKNRLVDPDENKFCPGCRGTKRSDRFWRNVALPGGLSVYCKACESIRLEERKKANPNYYKERYARARERQLAYYKKRREDDPQPLRDAVNRWRAMNRDHARAYQANRRARLESAGGTHTKNDISRIKIKQKHRCAACEVIVKDGYHVDHIMPIALGGTNSPDNLQILCPPCNLSKHAKDPIAWANERGLLI